MFISELSRIIKDIGLFNLIKIVVYMGVSKVFVGLSNFFIQMVINFKFDKIKRYLYLNILFCIISIAFTIFGAAYHDNTLRIIAWVFIAFQWVCIYLQHKENKRIRDDKQLNNDVNDFNL